MTSHFCLYLQYTGFKSVELQTFIQYRNFTKTCQMIAQACHEYNYFDEDVDEYKNKCQLQIVKKQLP